jgi:hypothetical protein
LIYDFHLQKQLSFAALRTMLVVADAAQLRLGLGEVGV